MKDRLIELIKKGGVIIPETAEAVADYLIENKVFVLPEKLNDSWELALPFIMRLFVADEAEIEKIKGEFELQKVKKILTDIRDYLEKTKETWKENNEILGTDLPLFALNRFIYDLTEYAEKLGVEL
jgi:DNA-binding ferritin-like protein (Dps family)